MQNTIKPRLIPALLALAFSGVASASGFQLLGEQNASGLGNAGAGSAAVAENASTVFYNPAGMTQLQAREVSLGGTLVKTSFDFSNSGSSVGVLGTSGDGNNGGGLGFVPNAYLSWAVTKDIYLGFGIGAPFGLKTEYDNPWKGAAQSISFDVKTINLNPSIAWRATDWVSLGFGLNWQKVEAEYIRAVAVTTAGARDSTATLKLSDDSWGWNAGALFNLGPATKLGDTKASLKLPDTLIVSLSQKLSNQWELLGDISWTGWSSIPKVDIMRTSGALNGQNAQTLDTDFRDTWRFAVGANYMLSDAWKLKMGIAYDQTPVKGPDTRLVSMPDNNRTWFSAGAQWKPSKGMAVDVGGAYLYVKDAEINNNQVASGRGLVKGTYSDSAFLLGAQFSMAF
jgi:long-chain fatty acid transport protein